MSCNDNDTLYKAIIVCCAVVFLVLIGGLVIR